MSSDVVLAVVLLGPPAAFGIAVVVDDWRESRRDRIAAYRADLMAVYAARRRHPSVPPEDRPDWGQP